MPFTFRVIFSGLFSFVPNQPFSQANHDRQDQRPTRCTVLAPDLRQASARLYEAKSVAIGPHVPLVAFELADLDEQHSTAGPHIFFRLHRDAEDHVLCLASQRQLRLRVDDSAPSKDSLEAFYVKPKSFLEPTTAAERQSLYWLTRMADAKAGPVRKELLEAGPLPPGIVLRMNLRQGVLRTQALNRGTDDELRFWQFDSAQPHAIAQSLVWEVRAQNHVDLLFDDGINGPRKLRLRPPTGRPGNDVVLKILHIEIERALGVLNSLFDGGPPSEEVDHDVLPFFGLAAGKPVPYSLHHFSKYGRHRGGNRKPCAPVTSLGE